MKKLLTIGLILLNQPAFSSEKTHDLLSTCERIECETFGKYKGRDYCDPGYVAFKVYRSIQDIEKGYVKGLRGDGVESNKNVTFTYYDEGYGRAEGFRISGEGLQSDPIAVFQSSMTVKMDWRLDVENDGFYPPIGTMNVFSCKSTEF